MEKDITSFLQVFKEGSKGLEVFKEGSKGLDFYAILNK